MTVINFCSDLHCEFWQNEKDYCSPGTGDVLILAGDIGLAIDLPNPDSYFRRFLDDCSNGYNKVFYVMGNHEFYEGDFLESENLIRSYLPHNITLLQNQSVHYNNVHFIGATLWTDFQNGNGMIMEHALQVMNDYHIINHGDRQLHPTDTLHEHDETITWLNQVLPTLKGKKVIITHHCPSHKSLSGRYIDGIPHAYATDLSQIVKNHTPNLIVHGHCHYPADYKMEYTRVVSNPRGYAPHDINADYQVKTITI